MAIHSNIHQCSGWTNLDKTSLMVGGENFVGYRIKKNHEGYIIVALQVILSNVLSRQHEKILSLVEKNTGAPKKYLVKFNNATEEVVKPILERINKPLDIQALEPGVIRYCKKFGLTPAELQNATEYTVNFAREKLKKFTPVVATVEDFKCWTDIGHQFLQEYYTENGSKVKPVQLHEKFKMIEIKKLSCISFVFLYLNDLEFIAQWDGSSCPTSLFFGHHESFLTKLKYIPVETPEVNDLVAYIDDTSKKVAELLHLGIYKGNENVLSKKGGVQDPCIYKHKLDSIPGNYGNLIRFYRKS